MSSTSIGLDLEQRVLTFFQDEVGANRFFARPECCRVFHKKNYFSRDRRSSIVFDIAIELSLPDCTDVSMVCLVECKNYKHAVPVDDVEEFFAKVQQVAPARSKAIIVASSAFQRGAVEFARAKGIGLVRAFTPSEFKWVLHRSPATLHMARAESRDGVILDGLMRESYYSERFDYFCVAKDVLTHSVNDFFIGLLSAGRADAFFLASIQADHPEQSDVAFVSREDIEKVCLAVHEQIKYEGGTVSLEAVCEWRQQVEGLTVTTSNARTAQDAERGVLGRISFHPPEIVIFSDQDSGARQRFTLAHELGHLLLGHAAYMKSECVDTRDLDAEAYKDLESDDIARLEWQANNFASCLLLARDAFVACTLEHAARLDLKDRGHGLIYLDHQPVNTHNYYRLTSALMREFEVSRTAIKIRLRALGLLNDASSMQRLGWLTTRSVSRH